MTNLVYLDPATEAVKQKWNWHSQRLQTDTQLVRYGSYGIPLLLFPTAGGDAEELERFFLIKQLEPFIHENRLKVYSIDSIAGRTWLTHDSVAHCIWIQQQFDAYIRHEVVPAIRQDCNADNIEIMVAGASIGALSSLTSICRHPDVFSRAICMSGTYEIDKWLQGQWFDEFHYLAPLHFVPDLAESEQLDLLRRRFVVIPTGQGDNEDPGESWKVAHALGQKSIPNRVDLWGAEWHHDWNTWRAMLPQYIEEMLRSLG